MTKLRLFTCIHQKSIDPKVLDILFIFRIYNEFFTFNNILKTIYNYAYFLLNVNLAFKSCSFFNGQLFYQTNLFN